MVPDLTSKRVVQGLTACSPEVVLSTLLFEEIQLLEGLQSVDSKDEGIVGSHTETVHELLELHIVEDHS